MNLRAIRRAKGLSQKDLSSLLDKDQTTISKWEKEKAKPSIDTMEKLSQVLKVPMSDLLACFYKKPDEVEL